MNFCQESDLSEIFCITLLTLQEHTQLFITKGEKEALANMQAYREKYGI